MRPEGFSATAAGDFRPHSRLVTKILPNSSHPASSCGVCAMRPEGFGPPTISLKGSCSTN